MSFREPLWTVARLALLALGAIANIKAAPVEPPLLEASACDYLNCVTINGHLGCIPDTGHASSCFIQNGRCTLGPPCP